MLGVTTNPDIYAEPPEERDAQEKFGACPHKRICQMQFDRNGDEKYYVWEWSNCGECEYGNDAIDAACPYSMSGLARCGGPY